MTKCKLNYWSEPTVVIWYLTKTCWQITSHLDTPAGLFLRTTPLVKLVDQIYSLNDCRLSGNSLRQTVHTHRASVPQAAKLLAALLRVAGVTACLAESNGSLPPGLWLTSPACWLPRTGISSGSLRSIIEYGLRSPLPLYKYSCLLTVSLPAALTPEDTVVLQQTLERLWWILLQMRPDGLSGAYGMRTVRDMPVRTITTTAGQANSIRPGTSSCQVDWKSATRKRRTTNASGEVAYAQSPSSRYDRRFVGIAISKMAEIYRVLQIKLNHLVWENVRMITALPTKRI